MKTVNFSGENDVFKTEIDVVIDTVTHTPHVDHKKHLILWSQNSLVESPQLQESIS